MSISNRKPGERREPVAEFYQRAFGKELPESAVNVALS